MIELNKFNKFSKQSTEEMKGGGLFNNLIDDSLLSESTLQQQLPQPTVQSEDDDADSYMSLTSDQKRQNLIGGSSTTNQAAKLSNRAMFGMSPATQTSGTPCGPNSQILLVTNTTIQDNDLQASVNTPSKADTVREKRDSRLMLIEEKASPMIEALQEHQNAIGPGSQKLI